MVGKDSVEYGGPTSSWVPESVATARSEDVME